MTSKESTLSILSKCVYELEQTSSSNEKLQIIQKYPQVHGFIQVILDPLKKTGLTRDGILKYEREKFPKFHVSAHNNYPVDIEQILQKLITREVTGDDAKEMAVVTLRRFPPYRELILRILEKDLKIRVGITLFRKRAMEEDNNTDQKDSEPASNAANAAHESYSPALAHDFQKYIDYFQKSAEQDRWYISRKLDGVRCQVWTTKPARALSRSGRPFPSLLLLQRLVDEFVPSGYVLDGEICVLQDDGSESFKDAVSHVKRKDIMKRFCFCVLDVLTETEFQLKSSPLTYSQRIKRGQDVLQMLLSATQNKLTRVTFLEQVLYSKETFAQWQKKADDNHWEGVMLRRDCAYSGKRTKDLLKVKKFETEEYKIEDFKVGPIRMMDPRTGLENTVQTVTAVKILHKGSPVYVGSGFSMEDRVKMYRQQDKFRGQVISVQYFEESKDKDGNLSLRFPTFKCWHGKARTT